MTSLPPIKRSISVSWDQATAFRRFTEQFAEWWPSRSHSIGGDLVKRIVFESGVGGRIYEEHVDGRRFQWGKVLEWDPPRLVKFTWHPSRDPSTAQDVELQFVKEGGGTRLELTSSGWDRWGPKAARARKNYNTGWGYLLNIWAGRRTVQMALLDGIIAALNLFQKLRGGRAAEIASAKGEMPPG